MSDVLLLVLLLQFSNAPLCSERMWWELAAAWANPARKGRVADWAGPACWQESWQPQGRTTLPRTCCSSRGVQCEKVDQKRARTMPSQVAFASSAG